MDVDVDEEEEEWHLDVEEDDIHNATNINMNGIEDAIDVEEIVKEWQMFVPFINRRMKHPCAQFTDNMPMTYADDISIFDNNNSISEKKISIFDFINVLLPSSGNVFCNEEIQKKKNYHCNKKNLDNIILITVIDQIHC
jgi:hypothetical protein